MEIFLINIIIKIYRAGVSIFYISKHGKKLKKICRDLLESLPKKRCKKFFNSGFYSDFNEDQSMFQIEAVQLI